MYGSLKVYSWLIRLNPTDDNMEKQSDFASQYYAILIIVLDVLIQEWILKIQHIKKKIQF
jgi:hypothetical protein